MCGFVEALGINKIEKNFEAKLNSSSLCNVVRKYLVVGVADKAELAECFFLARVGIKTKSGHR